MVELKGSLSGIGLPAIVQLIDELHHSGSLELSSGSARGVLDFDEGRLVAAAFDDESGLQALAALSRELVDGEFKLVDGAPTHTRTLDLGLTDVQGFLSRVANGEGVSPATERSALEAPPVARNGLAAPGSACPLLGFADDPARHYSRATRLHRCYAARAPSLVTAQDQRDLCLSGTYPECPRYIAADPAPIPSADGTPSVAPVASPRMETAPGQVVAAPAVMPAGVAARLEAAGEMRSADPPRTAPATLHTLPLTRPLPAGRLRELPRRNVLIGVGISLLVAAAVVVAFVTMGRQASPGPSVAGVQTGAPIAAETSVPTLANTPAPAPTAAALTAQEPTIGPTPAPAPPITAAQPTITPGRPPLIDIRFASGSGGWKDNAPFVAWTDGALRLQARQPAHFVAVGAPINQLLRDVVVSATFRKTGGGPGGGYGLVLRDQGPGPRDGANQDMSAYVLEAGDQGEFGIWRRDGDHWVDLVGWTRSASVRPGESPNDLTARAVGSRLTFTINGTEVATVEDSVFATGKVGVFVGGDLNEVALDRFTVDAPD